MHLKRIQKERDMVVRLKDYWLQIGQWHRNNCQHKVSSLVIKDSPFLPCLGVQVWEALEWGVLVWVEQVCHLCNNHLHNNNICNNLLHHKCDLYIFKYHFIVIFIFLKFRVLFYLIQMHPLILIFYVLRVLLLFLIYLLWLFQWLIPFPSTQHHIYIIHSSYQFTYYVFFQLYES